MGSVQGDSDTIIRLAHSSKGVGRILSNSWEVPLYPWDSEREGFFITKQSRVAAVFGPDLDVRLYSLTPPAGKIQNTTCSTNSSQSMSTQRPETAIITI